MSDRRPPSRCTASAPAKIILFGEHAVNRDEPALVTAIDRRARCAVEAIATPALVLRSGGREQVEHLDAVQAFGEHVRDLVARGERDAIRALVRSDFFAPVRFALSELLREAEPRGLTLAFESAIPIGSGLGSGAAVGAAGVLAAGRVLGIDLSPARLARLARTADIVAHGGLATGLDAAGAAFGGVARFSVAGGGTPLVVAQPPTLIVADTGVRASTAEVNARLQERIDADPTRSRGFRQIGRLVEHAQPLVARGDWAAIGRLMDENQAILADLGVSSAAIDRLVGAARAAGAHGAKLSGSGGGGIVIALAPPERIQTVADAVAAAGGEVVIAPAGAPGARIEEEHP